VAREARVVRRLRTAVNDLFDRPAGHLNAPSPTRMSGRRPVVAATPRPAGTPNRMPAWPGAARAVFSISPGDEQAPVGCHGHRLHSIAGCAVSS